MIDTVELNKNKKKFIATQPPPFTTLGLFTFTRTYARRLNEMNIESSVESFKQTIERVVNSCNTQLKCNFTDEELQELFDVLYYLKCSVAGRFLWQLGTSTVSKLGLSSLQNCAACVIDHPIRPFTWMMDMLMLGAGVGISVEKKHLDKLPIIKHVNINRLDTKDADYIVPDTREGWVKLLGKLLKAHFYSGIGFTYSLMLIREKGTLISGFGGIASGCEILDEGIKNINKILNLRVDKKLRSVDALDIANIIGGIVVSGNVRRSAIIVKGDANDNIFIRAKRWDLSVYPNYNESKKWLEMAAENKNHKACYLLHHMYLNGIGCNKDENESNVWLNKAIKYGHNKDEINIMDKYDPISLLSKINSNPLNKLNNDEISSNYKQIVEELKKLAEIDVECQYALGWIYLHGFGIIPNWRCYSNNSIVCNDITQLPEEFWEGYNGNGEPYGLINMKLSKSCGRLGEFQYSDNDVVCFNPCAEITLSNYETCCLSEIFLPNIKSKDELFKCASYLYRICKHSLMLPCHHKETQDIIRKNMRMGIGITGYLQSTTEQKSWLSECYEYLRNYDIQYSKQHNLPTSRKLTAVKPSGTLSLLANVSPGVHPAYSKYYIRRVRFSSNSPLVKLAQDNGYNTCYVKNFDGSEDKTTKIVEFPCSVSDNTIIAKNCTAIQQLEYVKELQTIWSDNAVSCTVYYKKHELNDIKQWLVKHYNNSIKSVSFLLHSDHGFDQAPYEEITKEKYEELISKCKNITSLNDQEFYNEDVTLLSQGECASNVCPIR